MLVSKGAMDTVVLLTSSTLRAFRLVHGFVLADKTCHHCFFSSKENLKWVTEMAYNEYQMQYFCSHMIDLYKNLPGMVDYDFKLKRY